MNFKEKLKHRLTIPLPGWDAQKLMSPAGAQNSYLKPNESSKKASVVLLVFEEEGIAKCIFIKRSEHPEDKHSGQISLPGGQLEEGEDYLAAGIREVHEEIGLDETNFEILGALTPIYVFVSDFMVQPYVAWMKRPENFKIQESEVAAILDSKIECFTNPEFQGIKDLEVRNRNLKDVPYYDLDGQILWGATAMIMSEFSSLIKE